MSPDETGSPAGGEAFTSVPLPADAPETFSNAREAADYFTSLKASAAEKKPKEPAPSEINDAARAHLAGDDGPLNELAQANADPETVPSEDAPDAEPPEEAPIEPPRSWTKAEKERFQSLPRETQEYLHTREQEREREFRRSQNEIADQRKAVQAEHEKAEKVRQQYEANLPALMQELLNAQQSSFADIRNVDDVTKLANEDPFRYLQWQAHQTKLQAVHQENERARISKEQSEYSQWTDYVQKQDALATEHIPELADKVKGPAIKQRAGEALNELGWGQEELAALISGKEKIAVFDHRFQRLLFSHLKLAEILSAPKAVAAKPLPPVQRPGTSRPAGSTASEKIQALEAKFNRTGNLKDAQALYAAQIEAQTRRAS